MPIDRSLGHGMAEVAGTAVLAHAIGKSVEERADLRDALNEWMAHAGALQNQVASLEDIVAHQRATIQRLQVSNLALTEERDALLRRNAELCEFANELNDSGEKAAVRFSQQVQYMRGLKRRLAQTEKALRHSSGRSVGMDHLKDFLLRATAAVDNHHLLSQQAMDVMERAYDQFLESGQLTPDAEMEKVLRELKEMAPDFKPGLAN